MKGTIYKGVGDVQVLDLPDPEAGAKDIIIKVALCGICGSDTAEYFKSNSGAILPGNQFGHEFSGTVVDVGKDVKGISEGMRVAVNPMTSTRGGRRYACMAGGFAEYVLVEDAAVNYNIYPLPDHLTFEDGALVEPVSVGMHGVNTAGPKQDDQVLILGAGPIGLGALAGMKALGVKNVIVSDLSEFRLQKAKELGASAVHNPKETDLAEFLEEMYPDQHPAMGYIDATVDAAGSGPALEDVICLSKGGSRISIVALHKAPIELEPMFFIMKDLQMKGSVGYPTEFPQVLSFFIDGKIDLKPMVTHRYPLSEIETALHMAINTTEAVKVMIDLSA
ncbi:MAG: zinc-binding dehydrogenase [Chloroflexota bacterium]